VLSKNLKESKKYQINGRDGDGKWTQNYDSIHLGKRKYNSKTNPEGVMLYPQTTIKSFEQQLQLSYYYVDTSQKIIDNNYSRIFVE
jgi:hypothetical protein